MPEISWFFGIIIRMFVNEHGVPHFHAIYQGKEASISIENGVLLEGSLSQRVLGFVQEWRAMHVKELQSNWQQGGVDGKFAKIKPLE